MKGLFHNSEAIAAAVDAVVVLGRELGRARAFYEVREALDDGVDHSVSQMMHAYDLENMTRDAITLTTAISLPGAAIQIAEASSRLSCLLDTIPASAEGYKLHEQARSIYRLLHSALAVVDREADEKLADIVDAHYGDPRMSPWREESEA